MRLKDLEVERHRLETPLTLSPRAGTEVYVHPLVGSGQILFSDGKHHPIGGRRSIFAAPPSGWLLSDRPAVIQPHGALDLLVASVAVEAKDGGAWSVMPKAHEIGYGNHRRTVYEILGGDGPALRLRCGETVNEKGGWSSWPPHSFDYDPANAAAFEEIFVPFMRPKDGLALLRRRGKYWDGSEEDNALVLHSGVMVDVPLGFHPIVGGPDTDLMYCFFYVSPEPKKYGQWAEEAGGYD